MKEVTDEEIKKQMSPKQVWDLSFNIANAFSPTCTAHGVNSAFLVKRLSENNN